MDTFEDLLNSTGGVSFSWLNAPYGTSISGTIVSRDVIQKRNFDTGALEFWDDGRPMQQIRIILQTSLRDAALQDDDGQRAVYVKGWGDQLRELRRVVLQSGAKDLAVGGTFTMTLVREDPLPAGKRGNPTKVYTFAYVPPSPTAGLMQEGQAQQPWTGLPQGYVPPAQPVQQQFPSAPTQVGAPPNVAPQPVQPVQQQAVPTPAPAPAAAATPPGMTPEQLAAFQQWQAQQEPVAAQG